MPLTQLRGGRYGALPPPTLLRGRTAGCEPVTRRTRPPPAPRAGTRICHTHPYGRTHAPAAAQPRCPQPRGRAETRGPARPHPPRPPRARIPEPLAREPGADSRTQVSGNRRRPAARAPPARRGEPLRTCEVAPLDKVTARRRHAAPGGRDAESRSSAAAAAHGAGAGRPRRAEAEAAAAAAAPGTCCRCQRRSCPAARPPRPPPRCACAPVLPRRRGASAPAPCRVRSRRDAAARLRSPPSGPRARQHRGAGG